MSSTILLKESNCSSKEIVYVRGSENTIVSLNASLNPRSSVTFKIIKDVFLPQGFPGSVSEDYVTYQLWDTLQAFCSTITNTLATRAVLQGVGVGDEAASSVSAAITWIMKDGVGMMARIMFAWMCGSRLDNECKKWRLFADVTNDIAICTELFLLPYFKEQALTILCISTSIKAIVGVAGGATRASITHHQAIRNNMADVSAKDGSQETCVNLVASFVGIFILSSFGDSSSMIWILFFLLTGLHLFSNFKAVKALNINKFNSERLNYVLKEYLIKGKIASSLEANTHESVFPCINTNSSTKLCGYDIKIGHSIEKLTDLKQIYPFELQLIIHLYNKRKYLIIINWKTKVIYILLDKNYSYLDILEAYFHAFVHGITTSYIMKEDLTVIKNNLSEKPQSLLNKIVKTMETYKKKESNDKMKVDADFIMNMDNVVAKEVHDYIEALKKSDWSIDDTYLTIGEWRASWKDSYMQFKK